MAFDIPNEASATFAPQAAVDSTDVDILVAGYAGNGVEAGCAVTAQGSPNMTVAVAAGTVVIGNATVSVSSVGSLSIGAAGASDRKDMVVVNNSGTVSVVAGGSSGAINGTTSSGGRDPVKGAIPANSVVLAEIYVATTTTSITSGLITDKRVVLRGPIATLDGFNQTFTLGNIFSALLTANGGISIPYGNSIDMQSCEITTGTRSTTTNASDAFNLGTFTGAALGGEALFEIDASLNVSTSAQRSKKFQFTLDSTTGYEQTISNVTFVTTTITVTVSTTTGLTTGDTVLISGVAGFTNNPNGSFTITVSNGTQFTYTVGTSPTSGTYTASSGIACKWYTVSAHVQSSNPSSTNDFGLEIARTNNDTCIMRFRQKSISVAGTLTYTLRYQSDQGSFSPSTTVTSAPPAVPSTSTWPGAVPITQVVAGFVGIGTDTPSQPFHLSTTTGNANARFDAPSGANANLILSGNAQASSANIGSAGAAAQVFTDIAANDLWVQNGTGTVRLGVGAGASTLRVTSTDVQINDNGTARSLPRGRVGTSGQQNTSTGSITTTETAGGGLTNVTFTAVAGRKYRINYSYVVGSSVAGDNMVTRIRDGAGSAPTNASTVLISTVVAGAATASASVRVSGFVDYDCVASGAGAGQINAGSHNLGAFIARNGGTGTLFIGSATAGIFSQISIDDVTA